MDAQTQTTCPRITKAVYELAAKYALDLDGDEPGRVRLNIGWTWEDGGIMDLVIYTGGATHQGIGVATVGGPPGKVWIDALHSYWRTPEGLVPAAIEVGAGGATTTFPLAGYKEDGTLEILDPEQFEEAIAEDAERAAMWANRYGNATLVRSE